MINLLAKPPAVSTESQGCDVSASSPRDCCGVVLGLAVSNFWSTFYLMAAANAADPKTERNRLGGSGRVGPSRAE